MPAARMRVRRGTPLILLVCAMFFLSVVHPSPAAAATGRMKLLRLINATRDQHDLHLLRLAPSLNDDARRHSRKMIRQGRIFDPRNLDQILANVPWDDLGAATTGCADSLFALRRAWIRSDPHREILLHPKLRRVGIGVIRVDGPNHCGRGALWVTAIYYG